MRQEREHAVRTAFISWAAGQSPPPALVLPEVSTVGKKIDLVCVEEPLDPRTLPAKLKTYLLKVWLRPDTHFNWPAWRLATVNILRTQRMRVANAGRRLRHAAHQRKFVKVSRGFLQKLRHKNAWSVRLYRIEWAAMFDRGMWLGIPRINM